MILYGKQDISQEDVDAVVDVLKSDWLTQGPKVPAFEQSICDYTGTAFAIAVNSATSALHIACLALGVGPGDQVWTSPITFVASANCALYCGASIDFVDVEPATGNMCPDALSEKLAWAADKGCLPKVIIPVHLCGHSCDMQAISALAQQYGVKVIEDASHGIGGSYKGCKLGGGQYSDITVFSFHPVKIITSAEGGMATTNQPVLAQAMSMLRSHGITKIPEQMQRPKEGDWYYEQHLLGYNYRMTELQAALGLSQMARLDEFIERRNELAQCYTVQLDGLPLSIVEPLSDSVSARHLQMIRLNQPDKRKAIFDAMRSADIQVHVHYFPVHLQPHYLNLGFAVGDFPQAEYFYEQILTLPMHTQLTEQQIQFVSSSLAEHIL